MNLSERIQKDLVEALRSKDELRLSVLRGIKSAIKYKETEKLRALDDNESIQILQTLVKQRKESIEQFTKGGREDLASKETKELAMIETYLPAGATEAEILADFPDLEIEDIRAALAYAATQVDHPIIQIAAE